MVNGALDQDQRLLDGADLVLARRVAEREPGGLAPGICLAALRSSVSVLPDCFGISVALAMHAHVLGHV